MFASHPAPKCRRAVGTWWDVVGVSCCVPFLLSGQSWLLAIPSSRPFRARGSQSDQRPSAGPGVRHTAGRELRGNCVSTGQACFGEGFLSPSCFVFTKMDF